MIKDIQLKNFIAHKDTKIEFCKGITIFLGHNGSGKSSIIDAVTFSLFGKHTRKSNKNLVRRGANHAIAQMRFAVQSKEFQAIRALNGSGLQSFSQLVLVSDGDKIVNKPIVGGERRQFGESMSVEIARVLGLNYEKLRVAGVVQQGELVRIVEAQPKDFKELLNGLIGIDRLDSAYETMRNVIVGFRERLRDEIGYTDEEVPKVERLLEEKEKELKEGSLLLKEFEDERRLLEEKIGQLDKEIERLEPVIQKTQELQNCEKLLIRHVIERRSHLSTEVERMERLVKEAKNLLDVLKTKEEVQIRLKMIKAESEEIHSKLEENEGMMGKLLGFLECASKLHIADGKCPVCNSPVTKVNEMFNVDHIQLEIRRRSEEKYKLQVAKVELKKEEQQLAEQDKKIVTAEKFLSNNSISSENDLVKIEDDLNTENSRKQWLEWKRRTDPDHYLDPKKRVAKGQRAAQQMLAEGLLREENLHGTINCDAINARGEICGVTTTSGLAWKIPGRIGDSPILGAGLYVDGTIGAAGSTGRGEANLFNLCSFVIVEEMRRGAHPKDAGMEVLTRIKNNTIEKRLLNSRGLPNFGISFYILNAKGEYAGVTMYEGGTFAFCNENGPQTLKSEALLQGKPSD